MAAASELAEGDFVGRLSFQTDKVERSLKSTGNVYAIIDPVTSGFAKFVGPDVTTKDVPILNGRGKDLRLDTAGFELVTHPLPDVDFYDEDQVLGLYYEEVCRFIKAHTNAYKVVAFDHVVRNSGVSMNYSVDATKKIKLGGPAMMVHGDYAMMGGPQRRQGFTNPPYNDDAFKKSYGTRPLIPEEELKTLRGRRFAIINLWRSFAPEPVVDMPLTMCDCATVTKEDYVSIEFRYVDHVNDTYLGGYNPKMKWYYFPKMTKDEGILIKTYDSQGALWADASDYPEFHKDEPAIPSSSTLHTAVKDPRVAADAPGRQSLEVRTMVFF